MRIKKLLFRTKRQRNTGRPEYEFLQTSFFVSCLRPFKKLLCTFILNLTVYNSVLSCDLCNVNLPVDQNGRRKLCAANCTRVKIDLWSSSNTAEISLKYLTCCNKLRATISYVCFPSCSLLYWAFLEVFPDVAQLVKISSGTVWFKLVTHFLGHQT